MRKIIFKTLIFIIAVGFLSSCEEVDNPTPTNELMQGVWELTEAYDAGDNGDNDIINKVSPLAVPNLISLNSTNGVFSTSAPLFMYIVYGDSKFMEVSSQLDQAFLYADSDFGLTQGEWSLTKGKTTDHFAIEMKMKFPTAQTITTLLNMMNITPPAFVESVIYHKFVNVKVEIDDKNPDVMWWTFDDETIPEYNIKDENLNYVLWHGVSTNDFSRCTLKFEKRIKAIDDIVSESYAQQE